jgi:putative ABC transport system permease protein
MDALLQDLRYAARTLLKSPGFAMVVVLTLALGIGANTAIFSVVNGILLRPLPYREPERLVAVWQDHRAVGREQPEWFPPPDFFDWKEGNRTFEGMVAMQGWGASLTGSGEPVRVLGYGVSHDFFRLLGVPLARGRGFTAGEDVPDGERVVVISHGFWQRQFGGAGDVVGRSIVLNDNPWTIVGVLPDGFRSPLGDASLFRPLRLDRNAPCGRGCYTLRVIGRLKPGVTLAQAHTDVAGIAARLAREFPQTNAQVGAWLVPLKEQLTGQVRPALVALLGAVVLVLLIACVNVANLLLARGASRAREVGIRTALGAARQRLVRQLLTESALLALAGGAVGLLAGVWGVDFLRPAIPEGIRDFYRIDVDGRVVSFTVALTLLASLVFGLGPAVSASRTDLASTFKEGGRGASGGAAGRRVRSALVVAEVALALMLLVGAGLLMRTFVAMQRVDAGFDPDRLLLAGFALPTSRYAPGSPARQEFYRALAERVARHPGVRSVALGTETPLQGGDGDVSFRVEGRPEPPPNQVPVAWLRLVSPEYVRTLGMRVVAGRNFTAEDRRGAPGVVLVNETMARRHWPGESPVGKRILMDVGDSTSALTVVGVVNDIHHDALDAPPKVELYGTYLQFTPGTMTLLVRTTGDPLALAPAIRRDVAQLDAQLPVGAMETMESRMREAVALPQLYATLFAVFAAAALVLAAIGIYGVIAYSVAQRTREIGVRMALGARPADVLRLVVRQGMAPAVAGVAVGLVGALAGARVLRSLLFGVSAADPLTIVVVTLFLAAVALTASYLPARRATRVAPTEALRYE